MQAKRELRNASQFNPGPHRKPVLVMDTGAGKPETNHEVRMGELAMLSLNLLLGRLKRWWMQRVERHYLMCADVEQQRAQEAQQNVAYYHKQAVLARSAQR